MALLYRDLQAMSVDELIAAHDRAATPRTVVGVDYYLGELRRREQERSNVIMIRLTWANVTLAVVATVIAVVSLLLR